MTLRIGVVGYGTGGQHFPTFHCSSQGLQPCRDSSPRRSDRRKGTR